MSRTAVVSMAAIERRQLYHRELLEHFTPKHIRNDSAAYDICVFGEDTGCNDWYYSWICITLDGKVELRATKDLIDGGSISTVLVFLPSGVYIKTDFHDSYKYIFKEPRKTFSLKRFLQNLVKKGKNNA